MSGEGQNQNKNQLLEAGKSKAKSAIAKKLVPIIIKMSIPLILIIFAGALLLGVFSAIGDAVQSIIEGIVDFFTIDTDGAIVVSDEQVDSIINSITGLGVSVDGLKLMGDVDYTNPDIQAENQKALRKYVKQFYEAQAMTQTLNVNPNWVEENILNGGKPYGTVYVHRTNSEDTVEPTNNNQMTYIDYGEMVEKQEAGDTNITKYFSVNEKGELVIAGWTNIVVKTNGVETSNETTISLRSINYKNVISQYTTSMNFFLYLAMTAQNPEFVSEVTNLVKKSDIRITVLDTKSTNVDTETYTYKENTKEVKEEINISYDAWDTKQEYPIKTSTLKETTSSEEKTETIETTTKSTIPTVKVTYAKTWFCEQTITYTKKETSNTSSNTVTEENEEEPELEDVGTVTWRTDKKRVYNNNGTSETYEEGTRGDVIDRTGEKGDGKKSFIGLLDVKFKIPNTSRKDSAGGNVVSGAEIFFYLLQKDASSQNLEQIMRYILYKYTGKDYGVTELDFNIFNAKDFKTIGGSASKTLVEYIHYWENGSGAPMNADGTKYIIHNDGAGHPTVGYGVDIFNGGFAPLFEAAGYPTHIGGEVDIDFVDALEKEEIDTATNSIKSITGGLDLKEYQIHALVSRAYNCGVKGAVGYKRGSPALNFVDSYNRYWNEETDNYYENKNPNANFNHSLYTQYMSKPVTSDGKYFAGLERRRKSEWILFQSGYYNVLDKWYSGVGEGGISTDEEARQLQEEIENEWIHTQYHVGTSQYQNGPFAKYWERPYNQLSKFQCTWWANGRASMYLEQNGTVYTKYPTQMGNGGDYYDVNRANGWFKYGMEPRPNSIISWRKGGDYGHVAYVEGVSEDGIYISHAGSGKSWMGIQKISLDGSIWSGYTLNGYIYLDEPN